MHNFERDYSLGFQFLQASTCLYNYNNWILFGIMFPISFSLNCITGIKNNNLINLLHYVNLSSHKAITIF